MMLTKSMNYAAIGLLSATVSMTALAATPEATTAVLSNSEATFAFADPTTSTIQLVAMDKQEMVGTEGAWVWMIAPIGRGLIGAGIAGSSIYTACPSCSIKDISAAGFAGFVGGALGNPYIGAAAGGLTGAYLQNLQNTRRW